MNTSRHLTPQYEANENLHELFLQVLDALSQMPNLAAVAQAAGVADQTPRNWLMGSTMTPNSRTLFAVAEALGFTIYMKRDRRRRAYLVQVK